MTPILRAAQLAVRAHAGQARKYSHRPYIEHPMRVAGRVLILGFEDEPLVCAAWLHDVIEDCGVTKSEICGEIDFATGKIVEELTNTSKITHPHLNRAKRKSLDRARIETIGLPAKTIKLIDRIDNLRDIMADALTNDEAAKFLPVYREESRLLLEVLRGTHEGLESELESLVTGETAK